MSHGVHDDWIISETHFRLAVARIGGRVDKLQTFDTMDHSIIEAVVDDIGLRLVRDRGSDLLEILLAGQWYRARNVIDFCLNTPPRIVAWNHSIDPSSIVEQWPLIKAMLPRDAATINRFHKYELSIGRAIATRLTASAVAGRARLGRSDGSAKVPVKGDGAHGAGRNARRMV